MKGKRLLKSIISMLMAVMMVIGNIPVDVYASAESSDDIVRNVWIQERDTESGELTEVKYELTDTNQIKIAWSDTKYDYNTGVFEGFRFQSDPATSRENGEKWVIKDDEFGDVNNHQIREDNSNTETAGLPMLCMDEETYKAVETAVSKNGECSILISYGVFDMFGDLEDLYGQFTLTFTDDGSAGAGGDDKNYRAWLQGRDSATGVLTEKIYEADENNEIRIPVSEAGYNAETGYFEGFRFLSDPVTVRGDDKWVIEDDELGTMNEHHITLDNEEIPNSGAATLYMQTKAYGELNEYLDAQGEYALYISFGKRDIIGDLEGIYGQFTLIFTKDKEVEPPVGLQTVTYTSSQGKTTAIENGDTLTVNTTEDGIFTCGSFDNDSEEVEWTTSWEGENQSKPIWIGLYNGGLWIQKAGTVNAQVRKAGTGEVLCEFTIIAEEPEIEELELYLDGNNVTDKEYTIEGHQWKKVSIRGRYKGSTEFVELSNTMGMEMTADQDFINCPSYEAGNFAFEKPGTGKITVSAYGAEASFTATSTYVPVDSISLVLPSEVKLHHLVYSMGTGDNYMGINQTELSGGITISPANSSYYTVEWQGSDDEIATYYDTHANGFVAHKEGTLTVTATVDDNGTNKSAATDVNFVFEKLVEGISLEEGQDTLTLKEEEDMELPIVFEPNGEAEEDQPSQTDIEWTYSEDGIVKIKQERAEYDHYASMKFIMTALAEGEVEVTGTPIAAKEGVEPLKFKVTVTESSAEPPNTLALVNSGLSTCDFHYSYSWEHDTWQYTDEWDIIALKRAGETLGRKEEEAVRSYTDSIKENIKSGELSTKTKPTTLARVALALEAMGVDASSVDGFDFYDALLNSTSLESGSNEPIWALIALDAKKTNVPKDSAYDREKLLDAAISFQTNDGGFNLSKSESGGDIDITAMAVQAFSNYQDNEKVKAATDKALDFLRESMQSSCDFNGTSESISQVVIAVSSLGRDIAEKENGFTSGKSKNVFTALDKYREFVGFKHSKSDTEENHMATQQAYMALASWMRLVNHKNSLYDMTDVASENFELPVITVTGAENNQTVEKKKLVVDISADAGREKIEKLQVWCNNKEIEGEGSKYTLDLDAGANSLIVKAVSSTSAVAQLEWKIKFSPVNYQKDIDNKIKSLKSWAAGYLQDNEYELPLNGLVMTHTRVSEPNKYILDKALGKIRDGIKFSNAQEWADMILMLTASGVDVSDIYGTNLWEMGNTFLSELSRQDSMYMLTAINSRIGQTVSDVLAKEKIVANIVPNMDGGFGENGVSNIYDTASAVIALSREDAKKDVVDKAVQWIADHQTVDGKFTDTGAYSDTECLTKVLQALCETGIDFTLDDRFNNPANIYTNIKLLYDSADDSQKKDIYLALADYQRIYQNKSGIYNMDDVQMVAGLTIPDAEMEQTVADALKDLDYTVYSPASTEAAYLLIRGNQATQAVYDYLDVLKKAVSENMLQTAREYYFAALYLEDNGVNLTDVDGVNLFEGLNGVPYTVKDAMGNDIDEGTVPMSYALLTLKLQPEENVDAIQSFSQRIYENRVPVDDWMGHGFYAYKKVYISEVKPEATIMAMMALYGDEILTDTEELIDYLGGKGAYTYEERQMEAGYWADYRLNSNAHTGNLAQTADMTIGLPMFGINIRTDSRFQKENGDIIHGIRAFARTDGFADTPEGMAANTEGNIAGYRALLAVKAADSSLPGIYDVKSERAVDRSVLDSKVLYAAGLQKEEYKEDTWNILQEALIQAEKASTQKEINLALEAVTNAIKGLKKDNEITVSFRLIGDWQHEADSHSKYVNWIKTKSYTVEKESKVYDVLIQALKDAGLEQKGAEKNYIKTIQAPSIFGGYALSEMTNGNLSGWKYMVNGEYPSVGLKECALSDGDVIIWRYIDNYTDVKDDKELWKEAEDLEPQEIFENIRTAAGEEITTYLSMDAYEEEQQKEAVKIVEDAKTRLAEALNTVSVNAVVDEAKKALDELPTKAELDEAKALKEAKASAKAELEAYKDLSLYRDKEKKALENILKEALARIEQAVDATGVAKSTEEAKKAMDAVKTAEVLEKEEQQKAADKVIKAIDKIKEPVTADQKSMIEAARTAYDTLTDAQKKLVTNYDKLTKAEEALEKILHADAVTLTDEKYGVKLKGDTLTKGMKLTVKPLNKDSKAVTSMRKEIPSSQAVFRLYEIILTIDGKETELTGKATLIIPVGDKYNGKELTVLYYEDGKVQKLSGKTAAGSLSLEISSLGSFGVVVDAPEKEKEESGKKTDNNNTAGSGTRNNGGSSSGDKASGAKTGDKAPLEVLFTMFALSVFVMGITTAAKKRKR